MNETKKLARIAGVVSDQCSAHNRRGGQCGRKALLGSKVCALHGGKAPQVMAAARRRLELAAITPERTLLEIARMAYADIASFFHDDGTIKKPSELDEDQRASLAAFEACITNVEAGDGHQDRIHRFRSWDETKALEMLAKHFGLFEDTVKHQGEIRIQLADRQRAIRLGREGEGWLREGLFQFRLN